MKPTALVLLIALLTACSGFSKHPKVPWPGEGESEFLYWCKTDGIWPVYLETPVDCAPENVTRGEWDKSLLPLTVSASPEMAPETLAAVEYYNHMLGFDMFTFQPDNVEPLIAVFQYGGHLTAIAEAKRFSYEGQDYGVVLVYNGFESENRSDMVVHELGHLLGLRHDEDEHWSVMYPSVQDRMTYLEPRDIKLLRDLYFYTPQKPS